MKRLVIIMLAVLGVTLYVSEITAFAQPGRGGGVGRRLHIPRTRERRAPSPAGRMKHGTEPSRARGSKGSADLGSRKSVNNMLTQNSKLSARLQTLLPGQNLQESAQGFKNLGQFVAAAHVSRNLGISFADLKSRMTHPSSESLSTSENLGTSKSLGKAIRELRPDVNASKEVRKANRQASKDLKETSE